MPCRDQSIHEDLSDAHKALNTMTRAICDAGQDISESNVALSPSVSKILKIWQQHRESDKRSDLDQAVRLKSRIQGKIYQAERDGLVVPPDSPLVARVRSLEITITKFKEIDPRSREFLKLRGQFEKLVKQITDAGYDK